MRYIFVINPAAGKGKDNSLLEAEIKKAAEKTEKNVEIYYTKERNDAYYFTKATLDTASKEEEICFVAVGGDGTLNEVLNGLMGYENAVLGHIPNGTGNDFVRNLPENLNFADIEAQLEGSIMKCDAISYEGKVDGMLIKKYCANMFNIGFDANVVNATANYKRKPLVSGSAAYMLGVVEMLIEKKGADLKIEADGEILSDGKILLTSIANGSYCGGGVKSNPYASLQDGKIDLSVINDIKRRQFPSLLPLYSKGTHLEDKKFEHIVKNVKADHVRVTPNEGSMLLCIDGELSDAEQIDFRAVPEAFRLLIPREGTAE